MIKFILKERNNLTEDINSEIKGTHQINIKPEIFLELTMPKDDWVKVKRFIGMYTSSFEEHKKQAEEIYKNCQVGEIGDEVIMRAVNNLRHHGGFKPELVSADSFALTIKGYPVAHVVNHSGRARSLMAALSGVKTLPCTLALYGKSAEEIMQDTATKYIAGQKFGRDPVNSVDRSKLLAKLVK